MSNGTNVYTGKRNQAETAWIVDPFLKGDPVREQLHNQLILAIFSNAQREPPDQPGVASWVAANDKPTTTTKPITGDAAEQRLKTEIMHLPPRERRRIRKLEAVCLFFLSNLSNPVRMIRMASKKR
jgi:transcriptional coactivator HFI1/ADA1